MCAGCVSFEVKTEIEYVESVAGDFPDGAYLAFCEERGVDVADVAAYFDQHGVVK